VPRRPWARFGEGSRLEEPALLIDNPGGMAIGDRVDIRSHVVMEALCPPGQVVLEIADDTYIGYFGRITALGGVKIGNSVLIADRVYLSDTGHVYEDVSKPVKAQPLREGRALEIGDGAWLGVGAVVVGGVRIGRGAVVGAGAVVRDDVPDHCVVVGNPARIVRRYVDEGAGAAWRWVDDLTARTSRQSPGT
jgi:acetyltransferase-like isoleucine patch superfamily enzyme